MLAQKTTEVNLIQRGRNTPVSGSFATRRKTESDWVGLCRFESVWRVTAHDMTLIKLSVCLVWFWVERPGQPGS